CGIRWTPCARSPARIRIARCTTRKTISTCRKWMPWCATTTWSVPCRRCPPTTSEPARSDPGARGRIAVADGSVADHRADHLALVHQVEGVIGLLERQHLGHEFVGLDRAGKVALDIAGQLAATLDANESRTAPDPAGGQL